MKRPRELKMTGGKTMIDIVTLYYPPTEKAKEVYGQMVNSTFINYGNLKDDEWVKEHAILETDFSDNIAKLNPHFCEMTTFYCVWKNMLGGISDDDFIRHSHYRKFLDIPQQIDPSTDIYAANPYSLVFKFNNEIRETNVRDGTMMCHPFQSWQAIDAVMREDGTFREIDWFQKWQKLNVLPAPMNLFCMKVGLFRKYCEWVFPKLFKIEKMIPYDDPNYRTAYQQRAIAFISERLFSFWVYCQVHRGRKIIQVANTIYDDFKPITDQEERNKKI